MTMVKTFCFCRWRLVVCVLSFLCSKSVQGQYVAGQAYYGTSGYIEYYAGDLPIILSAPHGGYLEPASIPDRNCSGCVTTRDGRTEELAYQIRDAIRSVFGRDPHIIINKLARTKLDANREIIEAALGNPQAETAWHEFHDFIQASKDSSIADYGKALYIDLHAHGHAKQRIELGYLLTRTELQNSDSHLDAFNFQDSSSIKHLHSVGNPGTPFSQLLRGGNCMGDFLHDHGYPSVPSSADPAPAPTDSYFNGGYNTVRHGSRDSSMVSAIQFELNYTGIRNSSSNREQFAKSLACVLRSYINEWYIDLDGWDPGNLVTSLADSGPDSLRSALLGASDGDTISIDPTLYGDTIRLAQELVVCADVTLLGPGADQLAISGGDSVRLIRTLLDDNVNVVGISLVQGHSPTSEDGGAILSSGQVNLSDCILADNFAEDDGGAVAQNEASKTITLTRCSVIDNAANDDGGGLRLSAGSMIIDGSTVANNTSQSYGGGLSSGGEVSIVNSTFSGNVADGLGGGIRHFSSDQMTITNSTISNNTSGATGGGLSNSGSVVINHGTIAYNVSTTLGGGIRNNGGDIALINTIASDNSSGGDNEISNDQGIIISEGYNLVRDTTGSEWTPSIGDILGNQSQPLLGGLAALTNNGGQTETIALLATSPAIDAAQPMTTLSTDQRGIARVFCQRADIGAFELHLDTLVWTGANSTDWHTGSNWDHLVLPTKCNVAVVPGISVAPNQPLVSLPVAACKDLYLRQQATLRIRTSGYLQLR